MDIGFDDFRQSYVVMKNEFIKFVRGKKILLFAGIIVLVLALLTVMPYVFGDGLSKDSAELVSTYIMFSSFIVLLSAALFASSAIVSEYEERTALVLFTKPLNKWSIFLGKYAASAVMGIAFIAFYYLVTAVISLAVTGGVVGALFTSLGLAILYTLAACGVAMLISSVMKRSSVSTLLAFVLLLMLLPMMSLLMGTSVDVWWMLDQAGNAISGVLPSTGFDGELIAAMTSSEILRSAGVMVGWAAVSSVIAYILFRRRQF